MVPMVYQYRSWFYQCTIGNTIGTNGKPMAQLATNGTIGKITNGTIGRTLNRANVSNLSQLLCVLIG